MSSIQSSAALFFLWLSAFLQASQMVKAHGYLQSPRSRNWEAHEDGVHSGGSANAGKPQKETCPHCLNTKRTNDLCSKGNAATRYDRWNDVNGNRMPWNSQGTYNEGGLMEVETFLDTNHAGHQEMYICPNGDSSTQQCLWENPLTMVRDKLYGGPTDPSHPERAYFANDKKRFKFTYKLPRGVCGEKVLLQWRYITANSCFPPGYKGTAVGQRLGELGWLRAPNMGTCRFPYNPTGAGQPEQFWNCAEITIKCANGRTPTSPVPAPTTPAPTRPAPTPPSGGSSKCGCPSCTSSILNRNASGYKVSARIHWLQTKRGMSERNACKRVCKSEFPNVCGECNPDSCGGSGGGGSVSNCCTWNNGASCGPSTWCNTMQSRCEGPCNGKWV